MIIIGCDFHTRYQQVAMFNQETSDYTERRLDHLTGEAQQFYRSLTGPVRVGVEATGSLAWFERLLSELGHQLLVGDAAKIRASAVRKQKTDHRDARLILDLLLEERFPTLWVPTLAERDLRQLLWHRHKLVTLRTLLRNQLHFLALGQGSAARAGYLRVRDGWNSRLCRSGPGPAVAALSFCSCSISSNLRSKSWIKQCSPKPSKVTMPRA